MHEKGPGQRHERGNETQHKADRTAKLTNNLQQLFASSRQVTILFDGGFTVFGRERLELALYKFAFANTIKVSTETLSSWSIVY